MAPKLTAGTFYGSTLKQYQVAGFSLSESRYAPGSTLPYHSHESHYFSFALCGSYKEAFETKIRSCGPSAIVYHPAGELHAQFFDGSLVHLFRIEVAPSRLRGLLPDGHGLVASDHQGGPAIRLANKLYREFREPDSLSHLAIEGLTLELIVEIGRRAQTGPNAQPKPRRWLSEAHELIKSNFFERLTLSEIAAAVRVHPVTLAAEFRRHYRCTVGAFVRRERIAFACEELRKSYRSVAEIGLAAGFCDQSHFTKTFKKQIGVAPKLYRENCN